MKEGEARFLLLIFILAVVGMAFLSSPDDIPVLFVFLGISAVTLFRILSAAYNHEEGDE